MGLFSRHELIQKPEGCTLVLYIEKQTGEFADELSGLSGVKGKEPSGRSLDYLRNYINENLRDVKIDTVNIMLGSLLVASIAYGSISAYSPLAAPQKKQSPTVQIQGSSPAAKAPVKVPAALLLVNKKHSLSDGYVPKGLTAPNVPSLNKSKTKMTPEAAYALEALFAKAKQDNIKLTAVSGYQFEPWHIRYVGKAAALEIASRNITLEEYLGKL